jgi:hypothetical protein
VFFVCEVIGGSAATSMETMDVGFFGEDELPPLSLLRVTAEQIRCLFEHMRHPDLPPSFD